MELWYDRPAAAWTEALPLGNGRLGAMVCGDPLEETVWLNEDTFWSGHPRRLEGGDGGEAFRRIRELALQGRIPEAEGLFERELSFPPGESYEPLGTLRLRFQHEGGIRRYRRSLDLEEAVAKVAYQAGGAAYHRETIVSHPHQVMALRLTADTPGSVSFSVGLDAPLPHEVKTESGTLAMLVQAPSLVEPDYSHFLDEPVQFSREPGERGMRGLIVLEVRHRGGSLSEEGGGLRLEGADSATILLAARTSFRGFDRPPDLPDEELIRACGEDLRGAGDYDALRRAHVADHRRYFDRVDFSLEGADDRGLPTDRRLAEFDPEDPDLGLFPLLFQYGRYLTIAGSRPGSQAMNLQGIWNHQVRPPWSSNYTLNINTQMNYWPAFSCGLGEMQEPLVRLAKELSVSGREVARELYGAPGFVCHHNTDLWRFAWPVGGHVPGCVGYAFWNMSAAWLCGQLFDAYEYTLDGDYLREIFPVLRGAAEFVLAMLAPDENRELIVCPATSPENSYREDGERRCLDVTSAMSLSLARELFSDCKTACELLGVEREFARELDRALAGLAPLKVGSRGQLLEWSREHEEEDPHHRHLSHLYGAFPGDLIDREDTPELLAACRRSLEERGDEGTGWSLAWKVCQWARQGDGDRALRVLGMQLRLVEESGVRLRGGGSYANLFCAHPPFQIDGNFGVTAGIAELLLQSRIGRLLVLPALPARWKAGSVRGLCAKGRIRADLSWTPEKVEVALHTDRPQTVRVSVLGGDFSPVELREGVTRLTVRRQ